MKIKSILILTILITLSSFQAFGQAGKSYSIDETLKELGAVISWDPFFASGVFNKGEKRFKFYSGLPGEQGFALFDGREVLTVPLPFFEGEALRFPAAFVTAAKASFSAAPPVLPTTPSDENHFRIAAIIIDPGHGGKDPGAIGTHTINGKTLKSVEKDIVLAVSKKLAVLLGAAYPGKKILLTRTGDTYPSLEERVNIANTVPLKDNEAIIYISIHANASLNKNARGYEVWYLPPETRRELLDQNKQAEYAEIAHIINDMLQFEFTSESTRMGRFILNRFQESFGKRIPSRGLKAENWYVVRNARMPAILVELGFVSNLEDARVMADETYLKLFSEALYKGIVDFVGEFEQSGGYTAP
ncbi:MAG: N-acetylmuramoyl-L-alanine amidase [Treponema sp.]|nr:N-acetylmuramoyl-L-alanine amidase [Treponema sp.]